MPLIKDGAYTEDVWLHVGGEAPLPASGAIVVDADRLDAPVTRAELEARAEPFGVVWPNHRNVADLMPLPENLGLFVLEFPGFADGRAFSQATALRKHLGFTGEVRARGDVLADQAAFMLRAGFDAFEVSGAQPFEVWSRAIHSVRHVYQAAPGDDPLALRHRA